MTSFQGFPEQAEARRLLDAALAEGPAHAYLFHGPPGVGKRARRARVRGRAARRPGPGRAPRASRPLRARAARRPDPDRRDPRAPPRPAHAAVRGRPPRLPRLRRAHAERGGRRRAAQGPRGAAAVRRRCARRRRSRPAVGDDPLALPARPVPAALRARRFARRSLARSPELSDDEATALARVARGRLDRVERLLDPQAAERREAVLEVARSVYRDPGFEPRDAADVLMEHRRRARGRGEGARPGRERGARPDRPREGAAHPARDARRRARGGARSASRSSRPGTATSSSWRWEPRRAAATSTGSTELREDATRRAAPGRRGRGRGGPRDVAALRGAPAPGRARARGALRQAPPRAGGGPGSPRPRVATARRSRRGCGRRAPRTRSGPP